MIGRLESFSRFWHFGHITYSSAASVMVRVIQVLTRCPLFRTVHHFRYIEKTFVQSVRVRLAVLVLDSLTPSTYTVRSYSFALSANYRKRPSPCPAPHTPHPAHRMTANPSPRLGMSHLFFSTFHIIPYCYIPRNKGTK